MDRSEDYNLAEKICKKKKIWDDPDSIIKEIEDSERILKLVSHAEPEEIEFFKSLLKGLRERLVEKKEGVAV